MPNAIICHQTKKNHLMRANLRRSLFLDAYRGHSGGGERTIPFSKSDGRNARGRLREEKSGCVAFLQYNGGAFHLF